MPLYEVNEGIALITLDRPPLNTLGLPLRRQIDDAIRAARADDAVKAVVITGAGRGFCGGGDITEFDRPAIDQAPSPGPQLEMLEASPKPVVAAIHGFALGGGLEIALACHARVVHARTQVGLPEVQLGLVPGAGGTQRLPRLIGVEKALNLIVKGSTHSAASLSDTGLFDRITEGDVVAEATELARQLAHELAQGGALRRTGQMPLHMDNAQAFFAFARSAIKAPPGSLPAMQACVDCVEAAVMKPLRQGLDFEWTTFLRLRHSLEFAGQRHVFLSERSAARIPDLPADTPVRPIKRTVVIGGGTMGSGIAMALANAGLSVLLIEREQAALDRALASIRETYESSAKRGKLMPEVAVARTALITGALDYAAVAQADLVIEAVFEDMAVKREIFERLDAVARPGAILASNTSGLDLDAIAQFTHRPQDVVGLHFFSPAHVMKLLEVVRGAHTAPDVLATAMALSRKIGKTAVVSGVCEGFIGNRMLESYLMQAGLLLDEGALPQQVDRAIEAWGMAMGPFRMSDMAGNDLGAKIRAARLAVDPTRVYSGTGDLLVEMGRHGQKVERGWYDHTPGQRVPAASAEVQAMVEAHSARLGLTRRRISDEEIVDRLLLALANEGCRILGEGIALRASDIDVVYTSGYGFPRWRGGPMFQLDARGAPDALATMERFSHGPAYQRADHFWRPAPLLVQMAERGTSLRSLDNNSENA
jgi:3-hydroxyacyl-CoA dehydrogenase